MPTSYVTQQGDMVDAIAYVHYGTEHGGTAEAILAANPGLAAHGPVLPPNLRLTLPDLPAPATPQLAQVSLYS